MGRGIVYCEGCGSRILEELFDSGEAVIVDNKNYCPECRVEVHGIEDPQEVEPAPEDTTLELARQRSDTIRRRRSGGGAAGRRGPTRDRRGGTAARERNADARGERGHGGRHQAPEKSNKGLMIGGGIAALVIIIVIAVVVSQKNAEEAALKAEAARIAKLEEQVDSLEKRIPTFSTSADGESIRKSLQDIRSKASGDSSLRSRIDQLVAGIDGRMVDIHKREGAAKALSDAVKFGEDNPRDYDGTMSRFDAAISTLEETNPEMVPTAQSEQGKFEQAYNKLAQGAYNAIYDRVGELTDDNEFDEARDHLDTFPEDLRKSSYWKDQIPTLRKLIEDRELAAAAEDAEELLTQIRDEINGKQAQIEEWVRNREFDKIIEEIDRVIDKYSDQADAIQKVIDQRRDGFVQRINLERDAIRDGEALTKEVDRLIASSNFDEAEQKIRTYAGKYANPNGALGASNWGQQYAGQLSQRVNAARSGGGDNGGGGNNNPAPAAGGKIFTGQLNGWNTQGGVNSDGTAATVSPNGYMLWPNTPGSFTIEFEFNISKGNLGVVLHSPGGAPQGWVPLGPDGLAAIQLNQWYTGRIKFDAANSTYDITVVELNANSAGNQYPAQAPKNGPCGFAADGNSEFKIRNVSLK